MQCTKTKMSQLKKIFDFNTYKTIIIDIKEKIIVILTSIMLGVVMGLNENESKLHKNSKQTEWENKKE